MEIVDAGQGVKHLRTVGRALHGDGVARFREVGTPDEAPARSAHMSYQGTFGIHFVMYHAAWRSLTAPDLVKAAEVAAAGDLQYRWLDDAFDGRHTFSAMADMAARVPLSYGTLVTYPWGQNPLGLAAALGTIAELLPEDCKLRLGISSGRSQARWVDQPKPVRMVREAIRMMRTPMEVVELAGQVLVPLVKERLARSVTVR